MRGKSSDSKRILLTGARAPVTLDLARHFHRNGHTVFLADSIRWPISRLTWTAKKTFFVRSPVSNPDHFSNDLLDIVCKNRIDLVIPTCEEIFYIAAKFSNWLGVCEVFCDSIEKLTRLHSKWLFVQAVETLKGSARSPESHLLATPESLQPWLERIDLDDWVFKPVYSRFAAKTKIGPSAKSLADLSPSSSETWLTQRRIRGVEYSTYSVARNGKLVAHACYFSEYRAGPGSGIYFVPVEDSRIRSFVQEFVQAESFTGQIGFDFIVDGNGELFVLECNPRATSGLHLLHDVNLSDAFFGIEDTMMKSLGRRPAMLASVMMLYSLPEALRNGSVTKLVRDLWRGRDVFFRWGDPLPAVLAPVSLIEVWMRSIQMRKPLTHAATFDIEWNGETIE